MLDLLYSVREIHDIKALFRFAIFSLQIAIMSLCHRVASPQQPGLILAHLITSVFIAAGHSPTFGSSSVTNFSVSLYYFTG